MGVEVTFNPLVSGLRRGTPIGTTLPIHYKGAPRWGCGLALVVMTFGIIGLTVASFAPFAVFLFNLATGRDASFNGSLPIGGLFVAIPFAMVTTLLAQMFFSTLHIDIENGQVKYSKKRPLLWNTEWEAPLSDFAGIEIRRSETQFENSVSVDHQVWLVHKTDKTKKLPLYVGDTQRTATEHARRFSELLGVSYGGPSGGVQSARR